LTLATVYSNNGWIGSLLAPFGIKVAFTRLGVGIAMLFISLPSSCGRCSLCCRKWNLRLKKPGLWDLSMADVLACYFAAVNASTLTGVALGFSRAVGEYGSVVIVAPIFHLKT